jgi:prepilin-type N-terminal cleavage/methylation domain-containing protein
MKKRNSMRKGFTLVEIVIVLAILAALYFTLGDSLFGKKESMALENSIRITTSQIGEGISKVGENSDRFARVGSISVYVKMGSKVKAVDNGSDLVVNDNTAEYINSIGLNGLCHYYIAPDKDNAGGTDNYGSQIIQDCSAAATAFGWDDRQKKESEDLFIKNMASLSVTKIEEKQKATAIAASAGNAAFTEDSTTTTIDAIVGVRYFSK